MREPLPHDWQLLSRHPTSEGEVRYERCHCGAHRIRASADNAGRTAAHQRFSAATRQQQGSSGD